MRRTTQLVSLAVALSGVAAILVTLESSGAPVKAPKGQTYYVRQTVGDDANDGLSPKTAWRSVSKLSKALDAGDTAYVGPGLYREEVVLLNTGLAESHITLIADTTGRHTGDPPGVVMITGADPVDPGLFVPDQAPGVYRAQFRGPSIWAVVEMDGDQYRYEKVLSTKEYLIDKMAPLDIVAKYPSSYYWDERGKILHIHTSDGKPPSTHEIELVHRLNGINMAGKFFITIVGFTFRHEGDGGITFFEGSGYGVAMSNTVWGSRQGIRVYYAQNIVVSGNTLFRNENAGVYFLKESQNAAVVGNTLYENIKGIRFGSKSVNAAIIGNTAFDNHEAGLSLEDVEHEVAIDNKLVNNKSQLFVLKAEYTSEGNCFENRAPEQLTVEVHFPPQKFRALADYQRAKGRDVLSREGGCGPLPEKVDVRKLHAESKAYAERARKLLSESR